jgi:MFS family permease
MRSYLLLFRAPGVARITASQLTARLPFGMIAIGVLIHVNASTGSYALGGIVLACFSIGEAISGPVAGRLLGRLGVRPVLLVSTAVCAASIIGIALLPPAAILTSALGTVAGLSVPPIMPAVRTLYPALVPEELLQSLFALDTSSQEAIWVVGPVLATILASAISTAVPLLVASAVMVLGGAVLVTSPALRGLHIPRSTAAFGRALLYGPVALSGVASFALVSSFCALEVAILARGGGANAGSGVVIALNALGSMIGGILLGRRKAGRPTVVLLLVSVLVFTSLAAIATADWMLLCAVFLAGFGFAPAIAAMYAFISSSLPKHDLPEAYGWLSTGSLIGVAVGTAVGGFAADGYGAPGAFFVATSFAAMGVVVVVAAKAWYPKPAGQLEGSADRTRFLRAGGAAVEVEDREVDER